MNFHRSRRCGDNSAERERVTIFSNCDRVHWKVKTAAKSTPWHKRCDPRGDIKSIKSVQNTRHIEVEESLEKQAKKELKQMLSKREEWTNWFSLTHVHTHTEQVLSWLSGMYTPNQISWTRYMKCYINFSEVQILAFPHKVARLSAQFSATEVCIAEIIFLLKFFVAMATFAASALAAVAWVACKWIEFAGESA